MGPLVTGVCAAPSHRGGLTPCLPIGQRGRQPLL